MTDTPETDSAARGGPSQGYEIVHTDFARKLERERDELREDLEFRRGLYALQTEALEKAREERDEARQWESQALVARIQRDEFSKTLGEVREILCDALPNENQLTSFMAVKLVKERDEARELCRWAVPRLRAMCHDFDATATGWACAEKMDEHSDIFPPNVQSVPPERSAEAFLKTLNLWKP